MEQLAEPICRSMTLITVDSHAHIFERNLPLAEKPRYLPERDATLDEYLSHLEERGIGHGVLVQPSFLGNDNRYLLRAIQRAPARLRGVAMVDPAIDDDELASLAQAGVAGVRLNLIGKAIPDIRSGHWPRLLKTMSALGMHVEIHRQAADLEAIVQPLLTQTDLNIVVDHFGRPDPALGVDDPGFRFLLETGATRRVWVKLAAAYRNGENGRGEAIALAAMPLLRAAFGLDRLVWGSDWPHNQYESTQSVRGTLALLEQWLPAPGERAIVLGSAAANLFGFGSGKT
jgi:predicted TIM-barrel fold metal-dependent hydrolase